MDQERSDKLDAAVAGLREAYTLNGSPAPSDVMLAVLASCAIDEIESAGFKIVRRSDA